ncbi:MAG: GNAT family N-acetyltransferase [Gammaproteobacteria bacterium]
MPGAAEQGPGAVVVREACTADVAPMTALLGELFAQEREFSPDPARQTRALGALLERPDDALLLVAVRGERVIGMVIVLYVVSTALGARAGILEDLIVDAAERGTGVGRRLVGAALARARAAGCRRVTLLTDEGNEGAQRFYRQLGFARSTMVPFRLMLDVPPENKEA